MTGKISRNNLIARAIKPRAFFLTLLFSFVFAFRLLCLAQENEKGIQEKQPIIVNADRIEYLTGTRDVAASGNVEVDYKGSKLTCQSLILNTQTKEGTASGNVRLDDAKGVIEGKAMVYNFETKVGTIFDGEFRANPYFGRADKILKASDREYIIKYGYFTTCSYNQPHYRITSKKVKMIPQDKIQTKDDVVYVGPVPIAYFPEFNRSLKDPLLHVQISPGSSKDWGKYVLTGWRYNLNEYIDGRIYLDYRSAKGVAEGFGANYGFPGYGRGDFKFYYMQERDHLLDKKNSQPRISERYFIRWRHKWDIDPSTNIIAEYYKIVDSKRFTIDPSANILKDYFFREYEKDEQPLSYLLMHKSFDYVSMDMLVQKRTNRWYTELEKLPEIKFNLPSLTIGNTDIYFENITQAASFNYKNAVPSPSSDDIDAVRFDTLNKFSLPLKVSIFKFTPFVQVRETFYNKDLYGSSTIWRTIFYSGSELTTKFYRVFNVKTNAFGLNINGLRHIITPIATYGYNHKPTILSSKLRQFDGIDSISQNNNMAFELSNKLQTKREGLSVDLVDFRINTNYIFKPKTGKSGSNLSDVLFDLRILPYSWLSIDMDATYSRSDRASPGYNHFSTANLDLGFSFAKDRTLGFGQRYQRKGSNELVYTLTWRLSPKWKFYFYHRREIGHDSSLKKGLREQEYSITRDLHCWEMDLNYNVKRGYGETIWLIFRMKAFPELEFNFNQSYHEPKPGSQSEKYQ